MQNLFDGYNHVADARPSPRESKLALLIVALCLLAILLLCPGCGTTSEVITTRIHYDRAAGVLDITSPKDTTIQSLKTDRSPDGHMKVDMEGYNARANEAAIQASIYEAQARAQMMGLLAQTTAAALGHPLPSATATPRVPEVPRISPTPVDDRKSENESKSSGEKNQGKPGVGDSTVEPGGRGASPQTNPEKNTINPVVGLSVVGNPAGLPPPFAS